MVCIGYRLMSVDGFVKSLVEALALSVTNLKYEVFKKIKPAINYRIEYQDIGLALKRLNLSSDYIVLSHSINFDLYYECYKQYKGYRVNTSGLRFVDEALIDGQLSPEANPYMIILKRDYLPYLTIEGYDGDDKKKRALETNIDTIPSDIASLSRRYIKAIVGLHYPKELRYIRIDIPYILSDMDIDKIRPITSLLG